MSDQSDKLVPGTLPHDPLDPNAHRLSFIKPIKEGTSDPVLSLRKKRSKSAMDASTFNNLSNMYLESEYRALGPEQIRFLWEENVYWRNETQSYRKLAQTLFDHFQRISQYVALNSKLLLYIHHYIRLSHLPSEIESLISTADIKSDERPGQLTLGLHIKKWRLKTKGKRKEPLEYVLLDNPGKDKKTKGKKALAFELLKNLNTFFGEEDCVSTLLEKLPHIEISTGIAGPAYVDIYGPESDEPENIKKYKDQVAGVCLTTYPVIEIPNSGGVKERLGNPNCDFYRCRVYKNRVIACVTDGCGWGNRSKKASVVANKTFVEYLEKQVPNITDLQSAALVLLKAIQEAHEAVIEGAAKVWEAGTTTIVGGLLLQVPPQESFDFPYLFLCVNVGDCKAYHCSYQPRDADDFDIIASNSNEASTEESLSPKWSIVDITSGNRESDVKISGGHLGPKEEEEKFGPDLSNFSFHITPCKRGDIIVMMSDGVHDNLDPEALGVDPTGIGLNYESWTDIDLNDRIMLKDSYRTQLLYRQFQAEKNLSPTSIASWALRWVTCVTDKKRTFMETNVGKEEPSDHKSYPGKMDHSTLLSFLVQ